MDGVDILGIKRPISRAGQNNKKKKKKKSTTRWDILGSPDQTCSLTHIYIRHALAFKKETVLNIQH